MRVGTVSVLDMVIQEHLRSLITAAPTYGLDENDLWQHGAAAQLAARALRAATPAAANPGDGRHRRAAARHRQADHLALPEDRRARGAGLRPRARDDVARRPSAA